MKSNSWHPNKTNSSSQHVAPLQTDDDRESLISALYGFLSAPDQFEAFLGELDSQLLRLSQDLRELEDSGQSIETGLSHSQIDYHFACAAQIFDRIGLEQSNETDVANSSMRGTPQWAFSTNGALLWQNNHASQTHQLPANSHYRQLNDDPDFLKACTRELARANTDAESELQIIVMMDGDDSVIQGLFMIQGSKGHEGQRQLNVSYCQLGWSDQIGLLLERSFGLSSTEQNILKSVVEGKNLNEIARERGRSIQTIRTQSKSLLRKTGAKSQAGLVRLFAAISLSMPASDEHQDHASDPLTHRLRSSTFIAGNGQRIQVDEYGSPTGYPVILFHGLFTGTGLTEMASSYIAQGGLRIIAPWRPGWNQTSGHVPPPEEAPVHFAKLLKGFMDEKGLEKVALVGRFTGCIYAAAAAQHLRDRVSATIMLSPTAPLIDHRQLRAMKGWQRVFAYAITYTPSVVPVLVRGMRQFLFRQETNKFLEGFYSTPEADVKARYRPEIQDLIATQIENSFVQGTRAHEQDLMLTGSDWSRYLEEVRSPILVMHGADNPVDPVEDAREWTERIHNARLEEVPQQGQLFVHSEPEFVWGRIRSFIQSHK